MKHVLVSLCTLVVGFTASAAFADGPSIPVVAPAPIAIEPESDWTGYYLGAHGGGTET